jgi:hypothetical protein
MIITGGNINGNRRALGSFESGLNFGLNKTLRLGESKAH